MRLPNWRTLKMSHGVLAEPVPEGNRLILWLPTNEGKSQLWERVSTLAGSEIRKQEEISAVAAASIQARSRGIIEKIWQGLRPGSSAQTWIMPNGESAVQVGSRRTDLLSYLTPV
jgi:hypothetical protein